MKEDNLYRVIERVKVEVFALLSDGDFRSSKKGQRLLRNINGIYKQADLEIEELLPMHIADKYKQGGRTGRNMTRKLERAGLYQNFPTGMDLSSKVHLDAVLEISRNAQQDISLAIQTANESTNIIVKRVVDDYQDAMSSGLIRGSTRKEMTQKVLEGFEEQGFTSFITRDGKELPLDFYAQTVTRTSLNRAQTDGTLNAMIEEGGDLFQVGGHTPTCAECWTHRGVIFSASGRDKRFPNGRGDLRPPYHPNCMCTVQPVEEDYLTDEELEQAMKDAEEYKWNQLLNKDTRSDEMKGEYKKDQALKRRLNQQKKDYAELKNYYGDEMPKTLGGYRRSIRANPDKYKLFRSDMRKAKRLELDNSVLAGGKRHAEVVEKIENVMGVDWARLNDIDADVLEEYIEGWEIFFKEFPEMYGFTSDVESISKKGLFAHYSPSYPKVEQTAHHDEKGNLIINRRAKTDPTIYRTKFTLRISDMEYSKGKQKEEIAKHYKQGQKHGHGLPSKENGKQTAIHEMSHGIEKKLELGTDLSRIGETVSEEVYWELDKIYRGEDMADQILLTAQMNLADKGISGDDIMKYQMALGDYAQKNGAETMAQSIASHLGTDENNLLAEEVFNVSKKMLKRNEEKLKKIYDLDLLLGKQYNAKNIK